jgi:hypothetical protein
MPRSRAEDAHSAARCGLRCAEATVISKATPNSFKTFEALSITPRSESLPITMPTSGNSPELLCLFCSALKIPSFAVIQITRNYEMGKISSKAETDKRVS